MKKWKKACWRYYHFTQVYHKWQSCDVWFLRYGVWWTEFIVILDYFLHFYSPNNPKYENFEKVKKNFWRYYYFTHVYHKWQSYEVWFLRYEVWQIEFLVILYHFLPFYLPNNLKNKNFVKLKKNPRHIIILHMCPINGNHMMYGSWDTERDGQNFLSFWTIFCTFNPLSTRQIKILKNWKKASGDFEKKYTSRYHHFSQMYQKLWSYATLFLRYDAWEM